MALLPTHFRERASVICGCVIACLVAFAHGGWAQPAPLTRRAQTPRIAIVELRDDADGRELSAKIAAEVQDAAGLLPVADPAVALALAGASPDETAAALTGATRALALARDELARFARSPAISSASLGQRILLEADPTPATTELLADLVFTEGLAELPVDTGRASAAFALVHRLSPGRRLDPARYLPEWIAAFEAARPAVGRATLAITGEGTLWLDGRVVGPSPVQVDVSPGEHVVIAFGPTRLARGVRVTVPKTGMVQVDLPAAPAPPAIEAARLRRAMILSVPLGAALPSLVALGRVAGASDAILITRGPKGELATQLWNSRSRTLSPLRSIGLADISALLAPLVPPSAPLIDVRTLPPLPPAKVREPWYQRRWVQASLVGTAVVVIGTALALTAGPPDPRPLDPNITFDGGQP